MLRPPMGRLGITILCAWAIIALNTSALAQTETEPSTEEAPATAEATPTEGEAETGEAPAADESEESEEAGATTEEADATAETAAPAGPEPAAEALCKKKREGLIIYFEVVGT